jgi:alpha-galactosidase
MEAPFSFVYDGKRSRDFLSTWKRTESTKPLSGSRSLRTIAYTDPATGLVVIAETTSFPDHKAVEWLLRMQSSGRQDTPLIEQIRPVDLRITASPSEPATFHYVLGSAFRQGTGGNQEEGLAGDFAPRDMPFTPGRQVQFSHYVFENGQHRESYLPFFNLQWQGGGLIGAIGWTGQWAVHAARSNKDITLAAGQETTHFRLHPGESIRTPRVLVIEWHGADWLDGQNELRRLLVAYYLPRINGNVAMPPVAHTGAYVLIFDDIAKKTGQNPLSILPTLKQVDLGGKGGRGFADPGAALNYVTEQNQLQLIRGMPDIGVEAYWLDAGWFVGGWPGGRGSWIPNKNFPHGLRPLGDAVHKRGLKFLLWFDPEGVAPGSLIAREHPDWVLHQPQEGPWGGIFRFGDPAAAKWMTEMLASRIGEWGVDVFRNDRNTNPLPFWQAADKPDRQGITEIRQIEGFYQMWDGLRAKFPKLEIDNANWRVTGPDLEVMKRSIGSLTRSEITSGGLPHAIADQAQTAELSLWIPLDANILNEAGSYDFRSTATTGVAIGLDLQSPYIPVDQMRHSIAELKDLRPFWLGDYYPLTPINQDPAAWCGWQFDRPDLKAGFAMLFRRTRSATAGMRLTLHGIKPQMQYEVRRTKGNAPASDETLRGADLAHLEISITKPGSSLLVRYREIGTRQGQK